MRCEQIIEALEQLSPRTFAESWDNVGLLAGRRDKETTKVYVALDATEEVIDEAIAFGAGLLLTHHPLIFTPMKKINTDDFIGRRVVKLLSHDISCYAMHTNFDVMGMADAAADEIGLKKRQVLSITYEDEIAKEGLGRIGKLPEIMTLDECAAFVKKAFSLESVRVYGDGQSHVEIAAISPGSGKTMIPYAIEEGAQVLITGDIDHHDGIDALARGLSIIDAGHYGLEKIFLPYMKEFFRRELPELTVLTAREQNPFRVMI